MTFDTYTPGTITVVLRDGRRFVYPEELPAGTVVADLTARGVHAGEILNTIHLIRRRVLADDPRETR